MSNLALPEFVPATAHELARFVDENARTHLRPMVPVGGRTSLRFGPPAASPAVAIDTTSLSEVLDYPVRDMTITVEAGIRFDDLQRILRAEGQRLPIDIAQSQRATLGGAIATNTSGPLRFGAGTFRDFVIGISAVDATGRLFSAGGRVVKNVAGYDLCKMLVGSLGTLAIITQVTLKVRPLAESRQALWIPFTNFRDIEVALQTLLNSATRPVAIELLNPKAARHIVRESRLSLPYEHPVLLVAFEGSEVETRWQMETAQIEIRAICPNEMHIVNEASTIELWRPLTDYQAGSDDPLTFQASLLPSRVVEFADRATQQGVAIQAHAGNGIVIGHLPDRCATPESAEITLNPLRELSERHSGSLTVLSCDETWHSRVPAFGRARPDRKIMDDLRRQLDPQSLLSPGRFPLR